jgi:hypothetical protein
MNCALYVCHLQINSIHDSFISWYSFIIDMLGCVCKYSFPSQIKNEVFVALSISYVLLIFTLRGWLGRFCLCMAVFMVTVVIKMNFNYTILITFPLCMSFCIIVNCNIARYKFRVIFVIFKYTLSSSQFCHN